MPNRFQTNERTWIYRYLCLRDGERCLVTKRRPTKNNPLEIDHIDGNPLNNDPSNLALVCKTVNLSMRKMTPYAHRKFILRHSATCVCVGVCVCGNVNAATDVNKRVFDYASGSVEMKLSGILEPKYREWIIGYLKASGSIRRKEATNGGAEAVGCSPATVGRYLDKLTSDMGILDEGMDSLGHRILKLKPDIMSARKPAKARQEPLGGKSTGETPPRRRNGHGQFIKSQNNDTKGEKTK